MGSTKPLLWAFVFLLILQLGLLDCLVRLQFEFGNCFDKLLVLLFGLVHGDLFEDVHRWRYVHAARVQLHQGSNLQSQSLLRASGWSLLKHQQHYTHLFCASSSSITADPTLLL